MILTKNIGRRVKALRKDKGLTQADLAEITGLSRNTIATLEGRRRRGAPTTETIHKLALGLEVRMTDILGLGY